MRRKKIAPFTIFAGLTLPQLAQQMRQLADAIEQVGQILRTTPIDYSADKRPACAAWRDVQALQPYSEQAGYLLIAALNAGAFQRDAGFQRMLAHAVRHYRRTEEADRPYELVGIWKAARRFWLKHRRGGLRWTFTILTLAEYHVDILRALARYLEASPQERHAILYPRRKRPRLPLHLRRQMRPPRRMPPPANEYRSLAAALEEPDQVYRLLLNERKLTALPPELGTMHRLRYLVAQRNPLETVPETLGALVNLRTLVITNNHLKALPATIGNLRQLEYLEAGIYGWRKHATGISELPATIGQLRSLRILDLAGHRLRQLPAELGHLEALEQLLLADNQLTELPATIGNLRKLRQLALENNPLLTLPPTIGQLVNLEVLQVGDTYTSAASTGSTPTQQEPPARPPVQLRLPPEIGQLSRLRRLDLRSVATLPQEIGMLVALQMLRLYHTTRAELPPTIGQLFSLQSLQIYSQTLTRLPDTLGDLPELRDFHLFAPALQHLPAGIGRLRQIHSIDLSGTALTTIPVDTGAWPLLRNLSLPATLPPAEETRLRQLFPRVCMRVARTLVMP